MLRHRSYFGLFFCICQVCVNCNVQAAPIIFEVEILQANNAYPVIVASNEEPSGIAVELYKADWHIQVNQMDLVELNMTKMLLILDFLIIIIALMLALEK